MAESGSLAARDKDAITVPWYLRALTICAMPASGDRLLSRGLRRPHPARGPRPHAERTRALAPPPRAWAASALLLRAGERRERGGPPGSAPQRTLGARRPGPDACALVCCRLLGPRPGKVPLGGQSVPPTPAFWNPGRRGGLRQIPVCVAAPVHPRGLARSPLTSVPAAMRRHSSHRGRRLRFPQAAQPVLGRGVGFLSR